MHLDSDCASLESRQSKAKAGCAVARGRTAADPQRQPLRTKNAQQLGIRGACFSSFSGAVCFRSPVTNCSMQHAQNMPIHAFRKQINAGHDLLCTKVLFVAKRSTLRAARDDVTSRLLYWADIPSNTPFILRQLLVSRFKAGSITQAQDSASIKPPRRLHA